jgi:hypothetical protein|tara:strand:- start:4860 stop:5732 length:873 start_codon:yes stop_codon:yes gene_type:complete
MKVHLASFYSKDLKRSAERFKSQAKLMGVYDEIYLCTFEDLNDDFKLYVKDLLKQGKHKGYGYWVWQTYIHKLILSKIEYGDIYHWCDIGCHFNINGVNRLKEYIKITSEQTSGFLGFQYKNLEIKEFLNYEYPNYLEYEYTKEDLFRYFKSENDEKIVRTPQVWGGSFFLKKNDNSIEMMNKHYDITRNRFDLIDDDETKFLNKCRDGFKQHRHSQSVLSILVKKKNCKFLSAYESEWALNENRERTFEHLKFFPIIGRRDKKKNLFLRFVDRQKKNFNRYKNRFFNKK